MPPLFNASSVRWLRASAAANRAKGGFFLRQGKAILVNGQDTRPVPPAMEAHVQTLLRSVAPPWSENYDVLLELITDEHMRVLNRQFRKIDKTTDVLAFQRLVLRPPGPGGMPPREVRPSMQVLGSIVIAVPTVVKQAEELEVTYEQRLYRLVAHGLAHLCGYTHDTNPDEKQMLDREFSMLAELPEEIRYPAELRDDLFESDDEADAIDHPPKSY